MVITGEAGVITVGYHRAATLTRWSLTMVQHDAVLGGAPFQRLSLTAIVNHVDKFWSTYTNFSLRLLMGTSSKGEMIWWQWAGLVIIDGGLSPNATIQAMIAGDPEIVITNWGHDEQK